MPRDSGLCSFCDKNGSGEVDYNEFEEAILDIFFNRLESTDESSAWKFKVVQVSKGRERHPCYGLACCKVKCLQRG